MLFVIWAQTQRRSTQHSRMDKMFSVHGCERIISWLFVHTSFFPAAAAAAVSCWCECDAGMRAWVLVRFQHVFRCNGVSALARLLARCILLLRLLLLLLHGSSISFSCYFSIRRVPLSPTSALKAFHIVLWRQWKRMNEWINTHSDAFTLTCTCTQTYSHSLIRLLAVRYFLCCHVDGH